ncbi:hypothetical protein GE21DRAFT_1281015 [Neurospora crassa]|nr:hypothetical protein GE21DRAFT_1281015 [Neurospora crassa]
MKQANIHQQKKKRKKNKTVQTQQPATFKRSNAFTLILLSLLFLSLLFRPLYMIANFGVQICPGNRLVGPMTYDGNLSKDADWLWRMKTRVRGWR